MPEPTKILLVEDNPDNRDMLSRRLIRKGYNVIMAVDGQEAIDKTHAERPAVVLMDMSLPVIDGWTATERLKEDPATGSIPIIALTAHVMASDRTRALAAGCDDYETKPIVFTRLLEKIQAQIDRSASVLG